MKKAMALCAVLLGLTLSGCFQSPTTPSGGVRPQPTATPGFDWDFSTPTPSPTPGGGLIPTPTPGTGGAHTVRYEAIGNGTININIVLDGNTTDQQPGIVSSGWTLTCSMDSGYEAYITGSFGPDPALNMPTATSFTLNIYVDGVLAATGNASHPMPLTVTYWLP